MDYIYISLLVFLSFRNGAKAKLKGKSPLAWGFMTLVVSIVTLFIGSVFVIFAFCKDAINYGLLSSTDINSRNLANEQLVNAINSNSLHWVTIWLFGIGATY